MDIVWQEPRRLLVVTPEAELLLHLEGLNGLTDLFAADLTALAELRRV